MKFYLISDNTDTQTGLRLAGIDGIVVSGREEAEAALSKAVRMPDVGIVLITQNLAELCAGYLDELKQSVSVPLITEIPDRHGSSATDSLTRYVREAIGM